MVVYHLTQFRPRDPKYFPRYLILGKKKYRFVQEATGRRVASQPVLAPAGQRHLPQGGNADADTAADAAAAGHGYQDSVYMDVNEEARDGKDEDWHGDANGAQCGVLTKRQLRSTAYSATQSALFSAARSAMHIDSEAAPCSIIKIMSHLHRSAMFRRRTEVLDASKHSMSKLFANWLQASRSAKAGSFATKHRG